jgi:hypothetical protein
MGLWGYWRAVLHMAWRHSLDHTQYVLFGLLLLTGAVSWALPGVPMIVNFLGLSFDVSGWQAASVTFGSIIIIRLFMAPFWLYKVQAEKADDLSFRLAPKIRLFLEEPENGVHRFLCSDGSVSKYVQFTVTAASDVALEGCQARLEKVERLDSDGNPTSQLAEEHIHCGWSNWPVVALDIHPRVRHRANLFHANSGRKDALSVDTVPLKILLPTEIQKFGDYRISVNVTAKGTPTCNAIFKFHWGGFDNMSLIQEA